MVRETRHLWVGNLPDNIREDRIREHFKRYGRVQNVKLLAKSAGGGGEAGSAAGPAGPAGGSGLCAAVAFMDIKSAAKAHGAEHTLDERSLTTVYYEPAAIPSSTSAGSSPVGSGYSASSGSVNSPRYPNHGSGEERCGRSGVSGAGGGGAGVTGGASAGPGAYTSPAAERARPRDRLYRNGPTSYNNIIERNSHRRGWFGYNSPPEGGYVGAGAGGGAGGGGGAVAGAGARRVRARSGSSSAASASSSRSGSSSSAPRSPSSSTDRNSSPENRSRKHQWSSSGGSRPLAICVRNLPLRSSDSSLKDGLFHEYKKHGKVSCVKVVGVNQDRYAVVCFKKPSDVEKALEVSQDKLFFGCKISVAPHQGMDVEDNESRPYETDLDEFHPKATRTLFIGNLEKDVTPSLLREKFKHFGKIIEIDIKKQSGGSAGYAFCQYANISSVVDAIRSMDGEHVGGSRVKLGFGKSMATNYVWIDGVTEHTEKQVLSQCSNFGTVLQVHTNKSTGHAVVVFEQVAAAQQAVKELRGLTIRNRKLQVDFASREYQELFYEQLEKCPGSGTSGFPDIALRGFEPTTNRYEEFSGGSGSEAGAYEAGGGSAGGGPSLQSVVVVSGAAAAPHPNMRHLQKERVHLLEQLEECQSSGDELVSPKKKFKAERISLGRRPSGETTSSRHHRELSPCSKRRRGSEASKHHWRSPTPVSRAGTPLRDERPDSPPPAEPRRTILPRRTQPMWLPLPRFAAQVLLRVPPPSPSRAADGTSAPASPPAPPPAPRVPSPDSSAGSSPSPAEPSLDERIRSLDERYEKWSGSRTSSTSECMERSRFRPRLLDLDINEVQPSEVMRSVLAKRSVFDEDSKRLESICDKYETASRPVCAFSSPSSTRLSPSPLNSPQSAGRSPYAGSCVVPPLKVPVLAATPPAKGLQYPFPSHPPSGLAPDGTPPPPPAPPPLPESTESEVKRNIDCGNIPRSVSNITSCSERVPVNCNTEILSQKAVSPSSTCSKSEMRTFKISENKSSVKDNLTNFGDSESMLKCEDKTNNSSLNSDSLDRRKSEHSDIWKSKTIDSGVLADEIRDQSFKNSSMCEKSNVDKKNSDVKHQDSSTSIVSRRSISSTKSESRSKHCHDKSSESNERRRLSKEDNEDNEHRRSDFDIRKDKHESNQELSAKGVAEHALLASNSDKSVKSLDKDSFKLETHKGKDLSGKEHHEKEKSEKERRDRAEKEKLDKEKLDKEKEEKEKIENERKEKERLEKIKIDKEKLEKERLEKERIEKDRLEKERQDKEKLEKERLEKERIHREKLEFERLQREKQEKERQEKERQEKERQERERQERERLEKERLEKERLEKERQEKEHLEKERQEKERQEKQRQEKECQEKERREKERLEKEKLDKEKLEKEKREKERLQKLENEKKEKIEKEKSLKEKQEKERLEKEPLEKLEKETKEKESSEKDKVDKVDMFQENKPDKHERRKERLERENKKEKHLEHSSSNDSSLSIKDKKKDKDDHIEKSDSNNRHRHRDHKKDSQCDTKKEPGKTSDNGKTKELSRKISRDETSREITRKDSSDSTASRHSHDSSRSKEHDLLDIKEESRHLSSKSSKHSHENHKSRHDKEYSPKNTKEELETTKSNCIDKLKEKSLSNEIERSPEATKEKRFLADEKHRHYSLDSHSEHRGPESKRKERLNSSCSLPANVGLKRRVSSQDSVESLLDEAKRPKLISDYKKLPERRDSKDSVKHFEKSKHTKSIKNNISKQLEDKIRDDRRFIKDVDERLKSRESKEKDAIEKEIKEGDIIDKDIKSEIYESEKKVDEKEIDIKDQDILKSDLLKQKTKPFIKDSIEDLKIEPITPEVETENDMSSHEAFLARLELRSSEEDEKQRALKEEMKEIKRLQQIRQIQKFKKLRQEGKKFKNEERKKEIKEKRLSNDRKSREDSSTTPKSDTNNKKSRKATNSSDTSDSDELKKHSIFEIVDDGPNVSMYDKVKARSCKNMQKQEEEKRQEKIKAKFSQLKQSRAKREEKKRSTSWDEDSDSDQDHKKSTSKSLIASSSEDEFRCRNRDLITTDSENDHVKIKFIQRKIDLCDGESTDDTRSKIIPLKKSRSRIMSDTSDDEAFRKKFPDHGKKKQQKSLKKEKNIDIKIEPDDNLYDSKSFLKLLDKNLIQSITDTKLTHLTDIKSESLFKVENTYDVISQYEDIKIPKYEDTKLSKLDDIKPVKLEDIKPLSYDDIKPTHCDISSEGEGIISDSIHKSSSYLEIRKKHKKKQKRQKCYPSDDEAKSDYHEKMQIINSICNSKNKDNLEKRVKHANKKDKKREKCKGDIVELLSDKEKSTKKPKKSLDCIDQKPDTINNIKRGEKMQDIFGPFSDESDVCNKEFGSLDSQHQRDKSSEFFTSKIFPLDSENILDPKAITEVTNKDKFKEEIKRRKEKKRKERKCINKEDENSLDIDAAGKAIEASLFDDTIPEMRRSSEKSDITSVLSSTIESDVFRFTDGDDSRESSLIPTGHRINEHSKKEIKEKKKKKKKNKEDRQNRKDHHHYHHHHHEKIDLTLEKESKSSDVYGTDNDLIITSESIPVSEITQKIECKPSLPSPSLPRLIDDSPPPTKSIIISSTSPILSKEINTSPTPKPVTVSKPGEIRRLSEKFIPGFGGEIDETISENAVKSISDFESPILDRKDSMIETSLNSSIDNSNKVEDKTSDKPRAVISQEETEDAVAALLGESFGGRSDGFSDCYSENTQSPAHVPTTSPEVTDNIPDEEAEEMRQAVQSLNASELEMKPDTPQSETDLQIDTDTDDGEESRLEQPSKTPEPRNISEENQISSVIQQSSSPQIGNKLVIESNETIIDQQISSAKVASMEKPIIDESVKTNKTDENIAPSKTVDVPSSTATVISKPWSLGTHKANEQPLLISATSLQGRDDKPVHIATSILHLKPIPQCRPILGAPTKISTSYQVVNSIPRPTGAFSAQPPTIKIPEQHVLYSRQPGIVISPRMSGDIRLHSPKSHQHGEMPPKITNMTILTTSTPSLHSPPGLHSPSGLQQRSPGQITVVRMQQPPLSPIQTSHLPIANQSRQMLSPGHPNTILIQNPSSTVQLNRLPITPVLAPISKPLHSNCMNMQQPKTAITSGNPTIIHPPKLISTTEGRKNDIRVNQDIVLSGPKLMFSTSCVMSSQNATIMAQNRLITAGNFSPSVPILVGSNVLNKTMISQSTSTEKPLNIPIHLNGPDPAKGGLITQQNLSHVPVSPVVTANTQVISDTLRSSVTVIEGNNVHKTIGSSNISTENNPRCITTIAGETCQGESVKEDIKTIYTTSVGKTLSSEVPKTSHTVYPTVSSCTTITNPIVKAENIPTLQIVNAPKIDSITIDKPAATDLNKDNQPGQIQEKEKISVIPRAVEKPKCETDFEELLKQSACETKIEKPIHITSIKTTSIASSDTNKVISEETKINNEKQIEDDGTHTENNDSKSVEVNHKENSDSKDNDFWSAKEVNIDSVIKKVDGLCSPSDSSSDSKPIKTDWSEKIETKIMEKDIKENLKVEITTDMSKSSDLSSPVVEKINSKAPSKRGGRARGRKISEGSTERIQTRQGNKPARGGISNSPRRGRGRVKVDKKSRSVTTPDVHLPGDVYDFHEDSGDECNDTLQSKNESRPRLILTIKSPISGNAAPNATNLVTSSLVQQKETPQLSKTSLSPGQLLPKDEKSEDFLSPAINTRKSRRLLEKDVTRTTVDDVIEDVVKNSTSQNRALSSKDSGPVRRSTRQNTTKQNPEKVNADVRKSPRAGKKYKDRRGSETSVDSSDERTVKKDPLEIIDTENKSPKISDNPKVEVSETPESVPSTPQPLNVITKPPKKMLSEINIKLTSTQINKPVIEKDKAEVEKIEKDQPQQNDSEVVTPPSSVKQESIEPEKPITAITTPSIASIVTVKVPEEKAKQVSEGLEELMLDPATGEMVYMRRGADGTLVPVPGFASTSMASHISPSISRFAPDSKSASPTIAKQPTCITSVSSTIRSTVQENVTVPSVVKSPLPHIQTQRIHPAPTAYISTVTTSVNRPPEVNTNTQTATVLSPVVASTPVSIPHSVSSVHVANPLGFISKSSVSNIHIPSGHIVSSVTPVTSSIIATTISKPLMGTSKPLVIQGTNMQQQQLQQPHVMKTVGGAMAGMKIGPGPLSPRLQQSLASKGLPPTQQMKPIPMQPQLAHHTHKQAMLRPGCVGAGPMGPSLPRGAQGQHASPPLHKHHPSPQPVIAGANSTRVGLTAVPSISPQGQIPMGEGVYPHFAHQHYQHYFRTHQHQDPRATPSPYVARSPLGAEGSEAPSPPLELRRPPCARVPHPAHSPSLSDRSTDSPQVPLYSSMSRYGEEGGGRYYEAPSPAPATTPAPPPPPAHSAHRPNLHPLHHHRILMDSKGPALTHPSSLQLGIDGGSAGEEKGPSRGSAPAQGGAGAGRTPPGPPHAAHAPREADSLMMLLRRYPVMWQGLLALKNDAAAVQMHFVHGNPAVASHTLPSNGDGSTPPLRIAQRMRLEPVQLEAVARKMQMENEHCMLLALPCGRDHLDVLQQSTHLTGGFITYLRRKQAAGIVNIAPPGHHQPLYTVHIFPSCDFANENLERIAPDLLHRVADIAHLLIVIATV